MSFLSSIRVRQTTHSRHDAQHIVVGGEDLHLTSGGSGDGQNGGINARHVESTRGLVLLGLQSKGIHVDTLVGGHVLVVLERLDQVEVITLALSEAIVTVQLQLGRSGHVLAASEGIAIDIVGPSIGGNRVTHTNPDQLLDGVVEVELDAVVARHQSLITSELELSDQVLVRELGETAALIGIQEDVVNPQRGGRDVASQSASGGQVGLLLELQVDLDFMVLHVNTLPFGIFV